VEQALKQRLVGAAVIIAVGVIVIPVLLDGAGERQLRKMPDAPRPGIQSRPGMVVEEEIKQSSNKKTGQIILTLPDEDSLTKAKVIKKNTLPPAAKKVVAVAKSTKTKPEKTAKAIAKPVKPKPVVTAKTAVKSPSKKPAKPPEVKKTKPTVTEKSAVSNSTNNVWVVQVGSFTDAKKAFNFRDSLRKKKFKAFVEKISGRSGQRLYRVRIGPVPSREKADVLSAKLKQQSIKGFVTRHP